jgi:uncharacterized protein (TIGR03435 family)
MIPAYLISALLNHLWQSTVFATIAGLLTLALRKNHARARYGLWLIASLKFLVPFSLLVSAGNILQWSSTGPSIPSPAVSLAMQEISQPFTVPLAPLLIQPAATPAGANIMPVVLFAIWACGFLAIAVMGLVRWRRVRAAVRAASPLPLHSDIALLSSPTLLEPGVFGILRPVLILPEGIADRLVPAELKAILAHELCHVRRRDNLAAALHMIVEAIFWFHPLVWWIGARLVEERERACDEEVLRLGSEPEVYAEGILKTCRFYLESPVMCFSGVTGSDLKKRIVRIMSARVTNNLSVARKLLLAAAGVAAVMGPVVFGLMNTSLGQAQESTSNSQNPKFDVASIKPNKSGGPGPMVGFDARSDRFSATNISLKDLIHFAYGVQDYQIAGGPPWLNFQRYDIEAKGPGPLENGLRNMSEDQRRLDFERRKLMLQSLLAERFKFTVHKESKEAPIYALVVAKNGPKLKEATAEEFAPPDLRELPKLDSPEWKGKFRGQGIRMGRGEATGQAVKLSVLAEMLSTSLGRTVFDKTRLNAAYDFDLKWTPDENQGPGLGGPGDAPSDPTGPSIFTAIEEQLGLKLEPQKGAVEVLVIDHAEKASEN